MREGGAFLVIIAGVVLGWMAITGRLTCGLAAIRCGFLGQNDAGCQASFSKCGGGTAMGTLPTLATLNTIPSGNILAYAASPLFSDTTNPATQNPVGGAPTLFGPNATIATA